MRQWEDGNAKYPLIISAWQVIIQLHQDSRLPPSYSLA